MRNQSISQRPDEKKKRSTSSSSMSRGVVFFFFFGGGEGVCPPPPPPPPPCPTLLRRPTLKAEWGGSVEVEGLSPPFAVDVAVSIRGRRPPQRCVTRPPSRESNARHTHTLRPVLSAKKTKTIKNQKRTPLRTEENRFVTRLASHRHHERVSWTSVSF